MKRARNLLTKVTLAITRASRRTAWLLAAMLWLIPVAAHSQIDNTATGINALASNTTGNYNSAFGRSALASNTSGGYNTGSGAFVLALNTNGFNNTASGYAALFSNVSGNYNVAMGYGALYSNETGNESVAFGRLALFNSTGSANTAVGHETLFNLTAGNNNIALGNGAGKLTTSGSNNVYIGHPGINGVESRSIRIGRNTLHLKTYIAAVAGTPLSGASVVIQPSGRLGVVASSARYKTDIAPLGAKKNEIAAKLARLQPVTYRYKSEPDATHYGLIAEEVAKVMPEIVIRDEQQRPETVQYIELVPLLLQQWKAQQEEIARLRKENAEHRAENARQSATIEKQNARFEKLEAALASLRGDGVRRSAALTRPAP